MNIKDYQNMISKDPKYIDKVINDLTKANASLNAFVTITNEKGKENKNSLLNNVPYAAKDLFSTKDILTTGSSNALSNYVPFFDATVIKKLKEAGTILMGKTVCDEFGLGGTGKTGHTGIVHNPWDLERIAGGSSAGSASIVASGLLPFALGTDTGDSIRKPAAYCGVVGYKPTYGLISRYGVLPFASSLDHVGVFTRNVYDASLVVDAIKGHDEKDMTSLNYNESLTKQINNNVKGKKIFYIKELCDVNLYNSPSNNLKEVLNTFNETLEICKKLGMEVYSESIDKKLLKAIYPTYMIISCAEATSNLSMYNGINYGIRGEGNNIYEAIKDSRTKSFSPLIKRRLVIGSFVLQKENQERYYLNACRVRRLIINTFNELFKKYDALILPASGDIAPLIKESTDIIDENKTILENYMAIGNFGGYPSITIPNGFIKEMPIGINITGKVLDDGNILNIASSIEKEMPYKDQYKAGYNE
jgi:aspartyl-tRNA(Asn)/glutamyl-tRNA(Gln) amidotransferase subunit A